MVVHINAPFDNHQQLLCNFEKLRKSSPELNRNNVLIKSFDLRGIFLMLF